MPGAVVAAAAYAWWMSGLRSFTWPALAAVTFAGVATLVLGSRLGRRPSGIRCDLRACTVWIVLLALLAGWELAAYVQSPRAEHPTLSWIADQLTGTRAGRSLAFLVWVAAGLDLARR